MTAARTFAEAVDHYAAGCRRTEAGCLVRAVKVYGEVWWGGGQRMLAHRATYLALIGPIPDGLVVRHKCDVKQCVEPTHLELGTDAQNVRDAYDRGQHHDVRRRGDTHPSAVLTAELVADLRVEAAAGASLRGLARDRGLRYTAVRSAVRGETWAHVTDPAPVPNVRTGTPAPTRRLSTTRADQCRQAAELADRGLSLAEIATALGVSRNTAYKFTHALEAS